MKTSVTRLDENSSVSDIDQRISDLRAEKSKIEDVYKQLSKFLHANAILPFNDDIVEYLRHFIQDEQMKKNAGGTNNDVIEGLEKTMKEFEEEMKLFKETIRNEQKSANTLTPEQIFPLVGTLYHLPINGTKIREQVDGIKLAQTDTEKKREISVPLPTTANSSTIMLKFKPVVE